MKRRKGGTVSFQSTLPARGATVANHIFLRFLQNFNPRSPHGERLPNLRWWKSAYKISIHAPRTGSDESRHSRQRHKAPISIHAPRTGSDTDKRRLDGHEEHFNPRSPHGERHTVPPFRRFISIFQSTLPARGATKKNHDSSRTTLISIHAPRTGSDVRQPCHLRNAPRISIHAPRTGSDRAK